jgi:hypothetical protein
MDNALGEVVYFLTRKCHIQNQENGVWYDLQSAPIFSV